MKKVFEVWVEDDAELLAICGGVAVERNSDNEKGVSFISLKQEDLKKCDGYLFRVLGKALEVKDGEANEREGE